MYGEYVAIFMAPLVIIIFSDVRHMINLGYERAEPVDIVLLILIVVVQSFSEIGVDFLCCVIEGKAGIDIVDTWQKMGMAQLNFHALKRSLFILPMMVNFVFIFRNGYALPIHSCEIERRPHDFENIFKICEPACLDKLNYSVYKHQCGGVAAR